MGFGLGIGIFQILFFLVFFTVFGFVVFTMLQSIRTWKQNNKSPRLTVPATLVSRRTAVHHRHGSAVEPVHGHTSTTYYVTFQVESGDRMEFCVSGIEYGMLAEGDRGNLMFQGTRYLGFERT